MRIRDNIKVSFFCQEEWGMLISFKAIGRNIRTARMDMNLTQEDVAERLKISQLHFGRLGAR